MGQLWSSLLHAQISDALGWYANGNAVSLALGLCDHVLIASTQILENRAEFPTREDYKELEWVSTEPGEHPDVRLFGSVGSVGYSHVSDAVVACDCAFEVAETDCGIRIPFSCDHLVFCPSGMEDHPIAVPLQEITAEVVTLPLANGLLQISDRMFLVKDTGRLHLAARIMRRLGTVEFAIGGAQVGKRYYWRLLFTTMDRERAVALANRVNSSEVDPSIGEAGLQCGVSGVEGG